MGKRNVLIKRSYEREKMGLIPNPYLFEAEANLMKFAQNSKEENFNHLYQEYYNKTRHLDKPSQMADVYVLARIYKFVLFKMGKEEVDSRLEKDYFTFLAMFQQRLDA